jgi:hypothetical protein
VVGITVSPTFHTFAVDPVVVTETPEQYRQNCEARAECYVGVVRGVAEKAGVADEGVHAIDDHPHRASSRPPVPEALIAREDDGTARAGARGGRLAQREGRGRLEIPGRPQRTGPEAGRQGASLRGLVRFP